MKWTTASVLALLVSIGCSDSYVGPHVVPLDEEFNVTVGHDAVVSGEAVRLSFSSVIEDSRCPLGAFCIWAGNGRIQLEVQKTGSQALSIQLNTFVEPKQAEYHEYAIRLIALNPYPKLGSKIDPAEYVARLRVSRVRL